MNDMRAKGTFRTIEIGRTGEKRRLENEQRLVSPTSLPPIPAKRRACTECRQAKIRCEAENLPCTRCRRAGLCCKVDTSYKRVNKRSKVELLEQELQQLRTIVAQGQYQGTSPQSSSSHVEHIAEPMFIEPSLPSTQLDVSKLIATGNEINEPARHLPFPFIDPDAASHQESFTQRLILDRPPARESRSLEIFVLHKEQIDSLFSEFFQSYHTFLPFLDPTLSPDQYYESSALLFWAIITTAARRYREEPSLFAGLSRTVAKLSWSTISVRPHSRFTIDAIILQIAWPIPTPTIAADNTYVLSGIAIQASIQCGLHLPENHQEFSTLRLRLLPEEVRESVRTWTACNIVAQSTTAGLGYPAVAKFGWTAERSCEYLNDHGIPVDLRHQLVIARFCYRMEQVLFGNPISPIGLARDIDRQVLITLLERDLDELEMQIKPQQLSTFNQMCLDHARLNLLVCHLYEPQPTDKKKEGLLKAFATASDLVARVSAEDESSKLLLCSPIWVFYLLTTCAFFLLKILNSSYAQYVDFEAGKKSFNATVLALRRWSVANNDLSGRIAEILAILWRGLDASSAKSEGEPGVSYHSRQGANLFWDGLRRWKEEFGGQTNTHPSPSNPPLYPTLLDQAFTDINFFDGMAWMGDFNTQVNS